MCGLESVCRRYSFHKGETTQTKLGMWPLKKSLFEDALLLKCFQWPFDLQHNQNAIQPLTEGWGWCAAKHSGIQDLRFSRWTRNYHIRIILLMTLMVAHPSGFDFPRTQLFCRQPSDIRKSLKRRSGGILKISSARKPSKAHRQLRSKIIPANCSIMYYM